MAAHLKVVRGRGGVAKCREGGGGATARMSDCHQMLVRRAEACEGGWFRAHWHVLGRCGVVVVSFPRSNAKMSCKTFWVRIEKRPYFEGYRLCGVTRRTRPQTTNQLAPRGQRVSRTFSRRVRYETPKLSAIRAIRCGDGGGAATAAPGAAVGMSPKIDIGVHAFSTLPARILFCKSVRAVLSSAGTGRICRVGGGAES